MPGDWRKPWTAWTWRFANRTLIRDPELIYPGQIFVLPEGAEAEAAGPIPRPDAARRAGAD